MKKEPFVSKKSEAQPYGFKKLDDKEKENVFLTVFNENLSLKE